MIAASFSDGYVHDMLLSIRAASEQVDGLENLVIEINKNTDNGVTINFDKIRNNEQDIFIDRLLCNYIDVGKLIERVYELRKFAGLDLSLERRFLATNWNQ